MAVYFAENTVGLTKTKLLKLVYLSEELFVKKHAFPFLGVPFHAWQFGPVQPELWANLDTTGDTNEPTNFSILSDYITLSQDFEGRYRIKGLKKFDDGEFSDDEISTLEHISDQYKFHDGRDLKFITHKGLSLWYKTVIKENGLLDRFESKKQTISNIVLDFADLFEDENIKQFYYGQMDLLEYTNLLKFQ